MIPKGLNSLNRAATPTERRESERFCWPGMLSCDAYYVTVMPTCASISIHMRSSHAGQSDEWYSTHADGAHRFMQGGDPEAQYRRNCSAPSTSCSSTQLAHSRYPYRPRDLPQECHRRCTCTGVVRELWRAKVHSVRAFADACSRLLDGDTTAPRGRVPVETACKKLFVVKRSMFLQFTDCSLPPPSSSRRM